MEGQGTYTMENVCKREREERERRERERRREKGRQEGESARESIPRGQARDPIKREKWTGNSYQLELCRQGAFPMGKESIILKNFYY
jgi:hypothetical protein